MAFSLSQATENTNTNTPLPAGTLLRVRMDFQGPTGNGESVETQADVEWDGKLIHKERFEGVGEKGPYAFPEQRYLKMKFTVTGTQDGKNINRVIFHNAVIHENKTDADRSRDAQYEQEKGKKPFDIVAAGQGFIWDMFCAARGVANKSPEGQALKNAMPSVAELAGKEFVVVTGKPNRDNTTIASRGIIGTGDKRYAEAMSWGKPTMGFGNAPAAAPAMSGFGGASATPPAGSFGGWG